MDEPYSLQNFLKKKRKEINQITIIKQNFFLKKYSLENLNNNLQRDSKFVRVPLLLPFSAEIVFLTIDRAHLGFRFFFVE